MPATRQPVQAGASRALPDPGRQYPPGQSRVPVPIGGRHATNPAVNQASVEKVAVKRRYYTDIVCGIAGERHFRGPADPARIACMLGPLARRGPDHEGQWHQGPVALGHRRLSVIDLNPRAHQPLLDPDSGRVLVFNGCIYNYPQLRTQLKERRLPLSHHGRQRGHPQGLCGMG